MQNTHTYTSRGFLIFPDLENRTQTLVVIGGPTAVGKTAVAIRLAQEFSTEIVSADSRQFFKELTIGTAKPTEDELKQVPHHFINSLSIQEEYDAARYAEEALQVIHDLFRLYPVVILCGGSGLYIKAVTEGFDEIPPVPEEITSDVAAQYASKGISWLQEQYANLEPTHFQAIDNQNPHRLMRALAVRLATGLPISRFQKKKKWVHPFSILKIGLELPREILYQRIDHRMDIMLSNGLMEEAKALYTFKDRQALQTVGYQEIFDFIDGHYDKEEMIRLLKRNSRRYAKRQLTWFKKDKEFHWYSPDNIEQIINLIKEHQSE